MAKKIFGQRIYVFGSDYYSYRCQNASQFLETIWNSIWKTKKPLVIPKKSVYFPTIHMFVRNGKNSWHYQNIYFIYWVTSLLWKHNLFWFHWKQSPKPTNLKNQDEVLSKFEKNTKWTKTKIQCCFNCWQLADTNLPYNQTECRKFGINSISSIVIKIFIIINNFRKYWW